MLHERRHSRELEYPSGASASICPTLKRNMALRIVLGNSQPYGLQVPLSGESRRCRWRGLLA
jgi:hypothetical protein